MNQISSQNIIFKIAIVILFLSSPSLLIAQEQKINIQERTISIENAFTQIENQTDYSIAYDRSKIDVNNKIALSLNNATLATALAQILKSTGLTYKIDGYHVILTPKEKVKPVHSKTNLTQTIRGVVTDEASGQPISYATVALLNISPMRGVITDSLGLFSFDKVPIGRYDIQVSLMGYEPVIIKEILLISTKESYNTIRLKERVLELNEIVITPTVSKEKPLNAMTLAGGRMFSVDEANRYAGGFDDPARLVTSFAGVSGTTSNSSVSIHGNAPQFLQWKLEGVEIPDPSHFAGMMEVGGGLYTGLSIQVMGNSDFLNSTFPAEYNNAISGVFDLSLRNGNNQEHEHTAQFGVMGLDLASEGPINKEKGSSYIINYRYSITQFVKALTGGLDLEFQDLSFKLNFPTRKSGTFSLWGLGLINNSDEEAFEDPTLWENNSDGRVNSNFDSRTFTTGIGHKVFVGNNAYVKTSLAASYADSEIYAELLADKAPHKAMPVHDMLSKEWNVTFNSYYNKKFSPRHSNRTGIAATALFYDLNFKASSSGFDPVYVKPMEQIAKGNSSSSMLSAFSNSLINITDKLSANIGLTTQLFTLNNSWSVEPRLSLKYQLAPNHSLAIANGLHSKRERFHFYYIKTPETGNELINKNLTLAKANNLVLSYNWKITDNIHLRTEPYFQYLFDVPVEPGSSFSIINHDQNFLSKALVNDGKGRNYGVDITLERYLNKGYYWLLTSSLFNSKYMGGDGVWRNTRYNRKYIVNGLAGKEWMFGKNNQNVLGANVRLVYQGGKYYTPANLQASQEQSKTVYYDDKAYSERFSPKLTADITVSYKLNRKKISHEFAAKILNVTGTTEEFELYYDKYTNSIETANVMIVLPNISYKIHF
jgi:hypothetical protein